MSSFRNHNNDKKNNNTEESNIEPFRRIETLNNFISVFNSNPTIPKELELWDISYQQSLKVDGFILQVPKSISINNTASLKNIKWVFIIYHSKITHEDWYDFFLVSQVAFKGSTNQTITMYYLMNIKWLPIYSQSSLFKFDEPATCQFAHKMAFIIGRTVGSNVDPSLSEKLFFL
ncbi:hypothetical protein ACTA71_009388 [Dictyostelium dimigraforme]